MISERPILHFGDDSQHAPGEPLGECAQCGSGDMHAVTSATGIVNYLCNDCGRCWSSDSVGVRRVDPVACPGCPDRAECFERLRQDIPVWGWWASED